MLKDIELSEFLCAKFCHDLAGPIGAINNGIDFFESDNEQMKEKAYELVRMSSKQAVNRLTFFRQAYGNIAADNETHLMELRSLILKFMEDSKLQLDFIDSASDNNDVVDGKLGKLLINVVIIATHVIMANGLISVRVERLKDQSKIIVSAEGQSHKLEEELLKILDWDLNGIEINSRNIQHYYTALLLKEIDASITVDEKGDKVHFTIVSSK
ncbi:MAG: histidine phosphotransferase family protein [Alphaproteobacteria bacterium]|jgi:histidine phosphotransferase ChpT